ncbi:MAG TPA: hypothetical protein VGQ87_03480 [Patescibacteria group bacterium]|jgi:hypothetical protein|nr:hypothetical protein [Patescibacteria group bacterium]
MTKTATGRGKASTRTSRAKRATRPTAGSDAGREVVERQSGTEVREARTTNVDETLGGGRGAHTATEPVDESERVEQQ